MPTLPLRDLHKLNRFKSVTMDGHKCNWDYVTREEFADLVQEFDGNPYMKLNYRFDSDLYDYEITVNLLHFVGFIPVLSMHILRENPLKFGYLYCPNNVRIVKRIIQEYERHDRNVYCLLAGWLS